MHRLKETSSSRCVVRDRTAVHVIDDKLPVRLKYSEPWETSISVDDVPANGDEALWLARCLLSPDDKVISRGRGTTFARRERCRVVACWSTSSKVARRGLAVTAVRTCVPAM